MNEERLNELFPITDREAIVLKRLKTDLRSAFEAECNSHYSSHRGAYSITRSQSIIYGNDSFTECNRAKKEVALVVATLNSLGIPILGFGLDSEGCSWAMRVKSTDEDFLRLVVWNAWFEVCVPEANPVKEALDSYLQSRGVA
jgi:hypothetical protein